MLRFITFLTLTQLLDVGLAGLGNRIVGASLSVSVLRSAQSRQQDTEKCQFHDRLTGDRVDRPRIIAELVCAAD